MSEKLIPFVVLHNGLDVGNNKILKREERGELPAELIPRLVELGAISIIETPEPVAAPKAEAKPEQPDAKADGKK